MLYYLLYPPLVVALALVPWRRPHWSFPRSSLDAAPKLDPRSMPPPSLVVTPAHDVRPRYNVRSSPRPSYPAVIESPHSCHIPFYSRHRIASLCCIHQRRNGRELTASPPLPARPPSVSVSSERHISTLCLKWKREKKWSCEKMRGQESNIARKTHHILPPPLSCSAPTWHAVRRNHSSRFHISSLIFQG